MAMSLRDIRTAYDTFEAGTHTAVPDCFHTTTIDSGPVFGFDFGAWLNGFADKTGVLLIWATAGRLGTTGLSPLHDLLLGRGAWYALVAPVISLRDIIDHPTHWLNEARIGAAPAW